MDSFSARSAAACIWPMSTLWPLISTVPLLTLPAAAIPARPAPSPAMAVTAPIAIQMTIETTTATMIVTIA